MPYISSFEQICIDQGMQAGMQQGMQQGIQAGEAAALQKLLTKRFGALLPSLSGSIKEASLEQIDAWFDRAITAATLADVFAEPPHTSH